MNKIDCIIIGYNEVGIGKVARLQEQFSSHSGAYHEIKTNSVLIGNSRETYMDLLNRILKTTTGIDWQLNTFKTPNLAVAYLASFLRRIGFSVEIINYFNSGMSDLKGMLMNGTQAVAITTTYYVDDEPIKQIIKYIRAINPEVKIIVGGPRIYRICNTEKIQLQDLILKNIGADIYIIGPQGEATLANVMQCLVRQAAGDLSTVPNLIYTLDQQNFERTKMKMEQNDLNSNVIQWQFFSKDFYIPTTGIRTATGCPFSCAFCNYPAYAGAHTAASIDVIEREMRYLHESGVKYLTFIDDTFNVPLPRFKKLCQMMIKNRFGFRWVSFFRCSNVDDEALDLMQASGCLGVYLGIESGDERILKNMRKFSRVKQYRECIQKITERNILILMSFIIGFPGETHESVCNTIDFLKESPAETYYNVQLYFHDNQAPIEQRREEFGIKGKAYSWSHNTMDWKEAIYWKEYMIRHAQSAILLPLFGFSIWTIPYLLQHGLSIDRIKQFAQFANSLLIDELNDRTGIEGRIEQFCQTFKNTIKR